MVHERSNNPESLDIKLLWMFNDIQPFHFRLSGFNLSTLLPHQEVLLLAGSVFLWQRTQPFSALGARNPKRDLPRALWRVVEAAAWWEHPLSSC